LGRKARQLAEGAFQTDTLMVSAISFWEIAMLVRAGRLGLAVPVAEWRQATFQRGIQEDPVTGQVGIVAGELAGLPGDPAGRIITATALVRGCSLLTADERILGWSGRLALHDARL